MPGELKWFSIPFTEFSHNVEYDLHILYNKKWRVTGCFVSCEHLNLKLRVFLAGYTVAIVTCYIEDYYKFFANDTITVVSSDRNGSIDPLK